MKLWKYLNVALSVFFVAVSALGALSATTLAYVGDNTLVWATFAAGSAVGTVFWSFLTVHFAKDFID